MIEGIKRPLQHAKRLLVVIRIARPQIEATVFGFEDAARQQPVAVRADVVV